MGLLITKVPDKETGKNQGYKLLTLVFLCFLISIIAYYPYFENGWYALDDYITLSLSGTGSFTGMSKAVINWLYSAQGRFQPVRLSIFVFLSRLFGEEQSVFYNFALHLINLLFLFYVLLKFRINHLLIFLTVLSFSVFGRWRSMESSSTMIGGSGLNLFFILTSILFLIKSSESKEDVKKYFYYALSVISYLLLTFSYEVAFPLFLPIFMASYFFSDKENGGRLKPFFKSIPYVGILLFYLIFFKLPAKGAYEGSSIQISPEILIRFKSYLLHTLFPPMQINSPLREGFVGLVFLVLYYFAVYICLKRKKDIAFHDREGSLKLLLFGTVFYFSSMILFCLNRWETPRSVMPHHTYLITAGGSIVFMSVLYNFQWLLPGTKRKYYIYLLTLVLLPLILLRGVNFNYRFYKDQSSRANVIKGLKKTIQASTDGETTDAILLKNFYDYYGITGVNGAFAKWFGFKKRINSGREISSVNGDEIIFKGPLTIYGSADTVYTVKNNRAEIFYFNGASKQLLPYGDKIDFVNGMNTYQTDQVRKDCVRGCEDPHVLESILRNSLKVTKKDGALVVSFTSDKEAKKFFVNLRSFELNGKKIIYKNTKGKSLYIPVTGPDRDLKFLFIKIESADREFKKGLDVIEISK